MGYTSDINQDMAHHKIQDIYGHISKFLSMVNYMVRDHTIKSKDENTKNAYTCWYMASYTFHTVHGIISNTESEDI